MAKNMNRIEKLIAEFCPEGVEWKTLGEVTESIASGRNKSRSTIGDYPVYGSTGQLGFSNKHSYSGDTLLVARVGANAGLVNMVCGDFDVSDNTLVVRPLVEWNIRFAFHQLTQMNLNQYAVGGGQPLVTGKLLKSLEVPIPPLPIQQEIVKILDTFTTLEAELEAELEARKKQYEYYRDDLLTFGDDVEWKTLGGIGKVSMCKRIFKNETLSIGDIPFFKIGTFGKQPDAFISREVYDEYRKKFSYPKKGDVLLSASGTIGRRVIYNGEPAYFQDSNIIWIDNDESKMLNKFLYYLYEIIEWKTEGGTIQRLYNDNLKKITIPIPPLAEQGRIVSILDKFDALVNDISAGLPAELNARRKQYEYYRDKLLTFKPLEKVHAK